MQGSVNERYDLPKRRDLGRLCMYYSKKRRVSNWPHIEKNMSSCTFIGQEAWLMF